MMKTPPAAYPQRIRSFSSRQGRITEAQREAYQREWEKYGLAIQEGKLDFPAIFKRQQPCILEVGFGSGQSLLKAAEQYPDYNFIGIEVYKPGIGNLLQGIAIQEISNIRIFCADVVDVITQCIPDQSLAGVQIFFPDPWPKRRHHKRRLIQREFIASLATKLTANGFLHLATDWEPYALHMMAVLSAEKALYNEAGEGQFAKRSELRPLITKFESRGYQEGRAIFELQFAKKEG